MFFGITRYTDGDSICAAGKSSIVRYYNMGKIELWGLKTIDDNYGDWKHNRPGEAEQEHQEVKLWMKSVYPVQNIIWKCSRLTVHE